MTDDRPPILHSAFAVLIVGGVLTWLLVTGKIREMVRRG